MLKAEAEATKALLDGARPTFASCIYSASLSGTFYQLRRVVFAFLHRLENGVFVGVVILECFASGGHGFGRRWDSRKLAFPQLLSEVLLVESCDWL